VRFTRRPAKHDALGHVGALRCVCCHAEVSGVLCRLYSVRWQVDRPHLYPIGSGTCVQFRPPAGELYMQSVAVAMSFRLSAVRGLPQASPSRAGSLSTCACPTSPGACGLSRYYLAPP
jgi:hypothetical protein